MDGRVLKVDECMIEYKKNNLMNVSLIAVLVITLVAFGTRFYVLSYAAAMICVAFLMISSSKEDQLCLIFVLLPWASLFKSSADSQSLFTYIVLFYCLLNFFKGISTKDFAFIALFTIYEVVVQAIRFTLYPTGFIKLITGMLLLSYAVHTDIERSHRRIFLFYIVGMLSSSVVAYLNPSFLNITQYVQEKSLGYAYGYIGRFAGMYADPNYYAIGGIICLCLIITLLHKAEIRVWQALVLGIPLIFFIISTFSKSALLALILPVIMLIYSNTKTHRRFRQLIFLLLLIVVGIAVLQGKVPILNTVLSRFDDVTDARSLTTGRSEIWKRYFAYWNSHELLLLFGHGLGQPLLDGYAAHNTYIDFAYYLGIIGSALYFCCILAITRRKAGIKRNFLNYSVLICIAIMYVFLSELLYIDMPYHFVLAIPSARLLQIAFSRLSLSCLRKGCNAISSV